MIEKLGIREDDGKDINNISDAYSILRKIERHANTIENHCYTLIENLQRASVYTKSHKDDIITEDIESLKSKLNNYAKELKDMEDKFNSLNI